ncbi:retrovirus-related pol polyprotein from transposon TNT 1-94 [Tanacetum coccineum]
MIQVRLKVPVRRIITDNGIEFVNQNLREYYEKVGISHETSVSRSLQQNGLVKRRNRTLIEATPHNVIYAMLHYYLWSKAVATAYFDELTAMASEHSSSGPALHEMTPATISSGLVPNPPPSTPFVPPSRSDWDLLFQPLFDELLTPPPSVDHPAPEVIAPTADVVAPEPAASTGSPSSTIVDQDAPSPSNSQTTPETQSPIIPNDVEEDYHDIEVAHMGNDPYFGIPILEIHSDQSSSSDSIHTIVHPDHQISEHNSKWTKDHPLENIIGELARPVSTRLQLHEQALFCYYDAFLTAVEPKTYKDALTQSCWIKAMQEELNEFERLGVWELVPRPDKWLVVTTSRRWNWILKELFALGCKIEAIRNFSCLANSHDNGRLPKWMYRPSFHVYKQRISLWFETSSTRCKHVCLVPDISDFSKGLSDPTLFILGRQGITSDADTCWLCQDTRRSTSLVMQFWGDRLLVWSSKSQKSAGDKIQSKHIDIRFHFIKEHVENGVIELYFVNTEYQLADIFTKALAKEKIEFLINKLGMQRFTPEILKHLTDEFDK